MATENFVSLSTVSLRLVKQPEHRPTFEKKLAQELRETLNIPEATPITTMPDTPLWWQRAKTIAQKMETERKYGEEHPECAKSPNGKHEWRFGTCVWCGTPATEVKLEKEKLTEEEVEKRRRLGLAKAVEISKKYAEVTGVVMIRDEQGRERWLPKKDYLMMLEAGRKVELLEEKAHIEEAEEPKVWVEEKKFKVWVGEKKFYYCDNPRHPHSEVVQILTYEEDPKCPICLKMMTYGKYWK